MDPTAIVNTINWTQYPLILIILVVVFFAQKWNREDRDKSDARGEKRMDAYAALVETSNQALRNNTDALRDLERTLDKRP